MTQERPEEDSRYGLKCLVIGSPKSVPLDKQAYDDLSQATTGIDLLAGIEEKFDIAFQNFIELESEITQGLIRNMYLSMEGYTRFQDFRVVVSRRVVNLLTAGRLYIDQVTGDLKRARFGHLHAAVNHAISREKASSFEFRLVEAMRNLVQHRALPIDGLTFGAHWLDSDGKPWKPPAQPHRLKYSASFRLQIETLKTDRRFDPALLQDVEARGKTVPVIPTLRGYMDSLGRIHTALRKAYEPDRARWTNTIREAIALYASASPTGGETLGLHAGRIVSERHLEGSFQVFEDPIQYLEELVQRNSSLGNVSTRFLTTQVTAES